MDIDNFAQAQALTAQLQATVPFKVFPTKYFLQFLRDRGETPPADLEFTVEKVLYAGDAGGITCALAHSPALADDQEVYVISISHLKIDLDHSLAAEVIAYQTKRVRSLKLQQKGGFAAELLAKSPARKSTRKPGFGK